MKVHHKPSCKGCGNIGLIYEGFLAESGRFKIVHNGKIKEVDTLITIILYCSVCDVTMEFNNYDKI